MLRIWSGSITLWSISVGKVSRRVAQSASFVARTPLRPRPLRFEVAHSFVTRRVSEGFGRILLPSLTRRVTNPPENDSSATSKPLRLIRKLIPRDTSSMWCVHLNACATTTDYCWNELNVLITQPRVHDSLEIRSGDQNYLHLARSPR